MIITETDLAGCYVVEPERRADHRGFFARTFSAREFESRGLNHHVVECSISFNTKTGTLRGMHYQAFPHAEAKLVRCTRGRVFDVAVDIRETSDTFRQWTAVELTEENGLSLYLSEGLAHGFVTLEPGSEIAYQMSHPYVPEAARGLRWNDPALAIGWPHVDRSTISERDRAWPLLP